MQLAELIDRAKKHAGTYSEVAKQLGITPQRLNDYKSGLLPCPVETIALIAAIAELDPVDALVRAVLEKHKGTERGERLAAALGKSLRATGAKVTGLTSIAAALVGTGLMSLGALAERATMYRSVKSRGPLLSFQP